jgi:serine/threonine protein kinase
VQDSDVLPRGIIIHERFRLGAMRARGGMATIYEGTEIPTDRHVAIKFLRTSLAKVPEMVAMFRAEAEALEKLEHPNIIRGLGSGKHGDSYYLVMEFANGPTLRERLKWGRPPKDEALSIAKQAAAGLDHAHARGVIHRDIKPDNFILEKSVVRLGDFGIAQVGKPAARESSAMGGTVLYSAPEQFQEGGVVDRRTDVYSLGVVIYEMFTGKVPFAGYKPASILNHEVTPAVDVVLEKSFDESPSKRYPSAGALYAALEAAFRAPRPEPAPAPEPPAPEPAPAAAPPPAPPRIPTVDDSTLPAYFRVPKPAEGHGAGAWLLLLCVLAGAAVLLAWGLGFGPFATSP